MTNPITYHPQLFVNKTEADCSGFLAEVLSCIRENRELRPDLGEFFRLDIRETDQGRQGVLLWKE